MDQKRYSLFRIYLVLTKILLQNELSSFMLENELPYLISIKVKKNLEVARAGLKWN